MRHTVVVHGDLVARVEHIVGGISRLQIGRMLQQIAAHYIAQSPYPRYVCLHVLVRPDVSPLVHLHAGSGDLQDVRVWNAAGGQQQHVAFHLIPFVRLYTHSFTGLGHSGYSCIEENIEPVVVYLSKAPRYLGILFPNHGPGTDQESYLRAQ